MNKQEFIERFVIAFQAAWAVENFQRNCDNGWPEDSRQFQTQDAYYLAERAWIDFEKCSPFNTLDGSKP